MTDTKCVCCGHFLAYSEMAVGGGARFHFEPDSHFGPEVAEWECAGCAQAGEAGTAETAQTGSVHEHAVPAGDAPNA